MEDSRIESINAMQGILMGALLSLPLWIGIALWVASW